MSFRTLTKLPGVCTSILIRRTICIPSRSVVAPKLQGLEPASFTPCSSRSLRRGFSNDASQLPPAGTLDKALSDRIAKLTTATRVVVLMKGEPMAPKCGFSNAVCRILEAHGVLGKKDPVSGAPLLSSFDILSDQEIREGAKIFSDWSTFPQVYIDGEFIGGCDILLDMHRSGKLAADLERLGIGSTVAAEPEKSS